MFTLRHGLVCFVRQRGYFRVTWGPGQVRMCAVARVAASGALGVVPIATGSR